MSDISEFPRTTDSSPLVDGSQLASWQSERAYLAERTCIHCGKTFSPKRFPGGKFQQEKLFSKRVYCSISCSKKHANPMSKNASRMKMRDTLKRIKHAPIARGGNGKLLPLPQLALLHALGEGWRAEFAVRTNAGHLNGVYPNCYKLDIANQSLMIGIELEGGSHGSEERTNQDTKKDDLLTSFGWKIFRVTNANALKLYSTFTSLDTLLTSLGAS